MEQVTFFPPPMTSKNPKASALTDKQVIERLATAEHFADYIANRLLKADYTSMESLFGSTINLAVADGCARLSVSHTLPNEGSNTFCNKSNGHSPEHILQAMKEFYGNSLYAGCPMVADTIICNDSLKLPTMMRDTHDTRNVTPRTLYRIGWDSSSWFIFNSSTGLLSDQWWHIYGYISHE